jgi:hypothetical protein
MVLGVALATQSLDGIAGGERSLARHERGLEDRSRKPAAPPALKRLTHLETVFGVVLNQRAAAAADRP